MRQNHYFKILRVINFVGYLKESQVTRTYLRQTTRWNKYLNQSKYAPLLYTKRANNYDLFIKVKKKQLLRLLPVYKKRQKQ